MILSLLLGAPLSMGIVVTRAPGAEDCPSAQQFSRQVEEIVGRPLTSAEAAPSAILVQVAFSRASQGYEARVQLTGQRQGERLLRDSGSTCDDLGDAVAIATALLFDQVSTPPASESRAASVGPSHSLEPRTRPFGLWLDGRVGVGLGLVSGPTWTMGGALGAEFGSDTLLELGAAMTTPRTLAFGSGAVRVRLRYAELGFFQALTAGRALRVGPSAALLFGVTTGVGENYPLSNTASLPWLAVAVGLRADFRVSRVLSVSARAQAVVPTRKQVFSVGYAGAAYESGPVAALADIAFGVKFW